MDFNNILSNNDKKAILYESKGTLTSTPPSLYATSFLEISNELQEQHQSNAN
jgi:hypothetical protein